MIPISNPSSPEPHVRKPKTPNTMTTTTTYGNGSNGNTNSDVYIDTGNDDDSRPLLLHRKNSFNSIFTSYYYTPRAWLLLSLLSLQLLLLFTLRSTPLLRLSSPPSASATAPASVPSDDDGCPVGRVFVYELPGFFNAELIKDCGGIIPFNNTKKASTRCDALLNDGYGRVATGIESVVPENLAPAWYWTDQFVSEIVFHRRILVHKCRTLNPSNATAFYIPFYAGIAVGKYLWSDNYTASDRDRHCKMMLDWVGQQPYYRNSNGWDHFLTMGRITWDFRRSKDKDWGSSCIHMPGMRNITHLLIERNPWDYFDVGVPYPTGFHPRTREDVVQWQEFVRGRKRTTLFCFAGAPRAGIKNDFRALLLSHCKSQPGSCRAVDCARSKCSNGTSLVLEAFLDSDFCLQPRGDSFTRRSIFDCMLAGSIPVLFWKRSAYYQYEWFLPAEPGSYSVFIDRNAVKNGSVSISEVLGKYSREEVKRMREKVIECIPRIIYARPDEGLGSIKDAFDVAIDGVFKRFKEQEEWTFTKW